MMIIRLVSNEDNRGKGQYLPGRSTNAQGLETGAVAPSTCG
jgi:hypothetical protein